VQYRFPNRKPPIHIQYSLKEFYDTTDFCILTEEAISELNTVYTVRIKVRYSKDKFFVAGNQFGFRNTRDDSYDDLHELVTGKLDQYFSDDLITNTDVNYIQLSFIPLNKVHYSKLFMSDKDIFNISVPTIRATKSMLSIPVANPKVFAELLDVNMVIEVVGERYNIFIETDVVESVDVNINGVSCNFIDIINSANLLLKAEHKNTEIFDSSCKFYYVKSVRNYILVVKYIGEFKVEKLKYSLSGVLINKVTDYKDGKLLFRTSGSTTTVIEYDSALYTQNSTSLSDISCW